MISGFHCYFVAFVVSAYPVCAVQSQFVFHCTFLDHSCVLIISYYVFTGQYDIIGQPNAAEHTKISSFASDVKVMASMRKPKRLIIRGDDESEHWYLVKGGEDLRLDQVSMMFYLYSLRCMKNWIVLEDNNCCSS